MTEGSWFRDRVDSELGASPDPPEDRLEAVVARAGARTRRRVAELAAAASVVLISLALVAVTVVAGRGRPAPTGDGAGSAPVASTDDITPAHETGGTSSQSPLPPQQSATSATAPVIVTESAAPGITRYPGGVPTGVTSTVGVPVTTSRTTTPVATTQQPTTPPRTTSSSPTPKPTPTTTATTSPPPPPP